MPELPEVELTCAQLESHLVGRTVTKVEVLRGETRYLADGQADLLVGRRALSVWRVGKVIYVSFDPNGDCTLRCHLAMSGFWSCREEPWTYNYVEADRRPGDESHVRVVLHLDDGRHVLYHDQRLFGRMELLGPDSDQREPGNMWEYYTGRFGIYPEITGAEYFLLVRTYGDRPIRQFLCDQNEVPGIGNIYAAEALYHARIHPLRPANSLSYRQVARLRRNVWRELDDAVKRELDYSKLRVYREKDCWHCESDIQTCEVDGRTVYFCPTCQTYENSF